MIPENEWKFLEATEQRIKHLARHETENLVALATGAGPLTDPLGLGEKRAQLAQEMDYAARVEQALASDPTPLQARHLDLHRRWILSTIFETHPEILPVLVSLREKLLRFRPTLGGREAGWSECRNLVEFDANQDLREEAWYASTPLAEALQDEVKELIQLRELLARAVAQTSFPATACFALQVERTEMITLLDDFERNTRRGYGEAQGEVGGAIQERGLEPWDFSYGLHQLCPIPHEAFSREGAWEAAQLQARRWGFDLDALGLDLRHADSVLGAIHAPQDVPGEVTLVCPPLLGAPYWETLFRLVGKGLHSTHAHTRRHFLEQDAPVMVEAVGQLFAAVLEEPAWIEEALDAPPPAARTFTRTRRYQRILDLRLACAQSSFENLVYTHGDIDPQKLYLDVTEQMMSWTRRPMVTWAAVPGVVLNPMGASIPLLGAFVGAHLVEHLAGRHPEWWKQAETGAWLREEILAPGGTLSWQEKLERATGKPLDSGALRRRLQQEHFAGPTLDDNAPQELSDEAVEEYFKDIDLSDID